jgi:hypothetical protein
MKVDILGHCSGLQNFSKILSYMYYMVLLLLGMCYIICTTRSSVFYVASGAQVGLRGDARPPVQGLQGGDIPPLLGFDGNAPYNFFPRETCVIFASFFLLPQFSCPLLGGFSSHCFCQCFSIFGSGIRVVD